jgi:uncharacterized protein (DUF1697 family)
MARHILLLRGINVGSRNRLAMPALRAALVEVGFDDVRTYLQSGNVVLSSTGKATDVARNVERLVEREFCLKVPVVARTRAQLAKVIDADPLGNVAKNPKRYQVSFLAARPTREVIRRIEETAVPPEQVLVIGREIYAWHPETIASSKLWALLAGQSLGVTATTRNWTTVQKLLALADAQAAS